MATFNGLSISLLNVSPCKTIGTGRPLEVGRRLELH
jgi:hypothetical protein